ncbi:MAG: hypothetical protein Kow0029_28100 [Candidatus Rifleibacteriota bacterium]
MKNSNETKEMMAMFAQNPQKGFEQIYKSFAGPVFRYLRNSFALSREDAEDILQTVFMPWVKEPAKFFHVDNPAGYLFTSARNAALKLKKSAKSGHTTIDCSNDQPNTTDQKIENELMIKKALESLPDEQKETVVLKIWTNMTFEEIAGLQQCSLPTVASRYRYAIAKLKELIPWTR